MRSAQLPEMIYFICLLGMLPVGWTSEYSSGTLEQIVHGLKTRIETIEEYILKTGNIDDIPPSLFKRMEEQELGQLELQLDNLNIHRGEAMSDNISSRNDVLIPTDRKPDAYKYLGCYKDSWTRALPHQCKVPQLTNGKCRMCCLKRKFTHFGTEIGDQCFCGDKVSKGHGMVDDSDCRSPCKGDKGSRCGGPWRMSIYQISDLNIPKIEV
ncbi:WSC domain-containing protein ARB_07867-like isoform X1 [Haliotis rubra]|uniref:WSC domain-containing protein ARB_07867-like isoform X1 n=1 Tax=Haliotis rubra TaxID=36100 RepID=UPI001EE500A6|nr:WSC domain-containing protein ARB_07867-like isoform X1 [Haliotis rubra]